MAATTTTSEDAAAATTAAPAPTPTTKIMIKDKKAGRVLLPSHVVPTKYDLHITPDLVNYTFSGVVHITMTVAATTEASTEWSKKIQLHAKELTFTKASYQVIDGSSVSMGPPVEAEEVRLPLESLYTFVVVVIVIVVWSVAKQHTHGTQDVCWERDYFCGRLKETIKRK
jgi:Peptidase M1 N-terminal domain